MTRPSTFDSQAYSDRFGGALSDLAGEDYVQGQGALSDPNQQPDYDQDSNYRTLMASNQGGAAPMPSPMQMSRQMSRLKPPGGALDQRGQGGGALSPQSSSPFFSQDQKQSADVYDYTDNAPKEQLDAHARHIDETVGAGTGDHGIRDMNHLWEQTYQDQLNKRGQQSLMDQDTASGYMKPTWRDKLAMMLDAANRASIIQAQNPQMSKGQIWAAATRGAMDGWEAHVQGAHDAYLQNQNAMRTQAGKDADAAVKRQMDTLGLEAKATQLQQNQAKIDETHRHNVEDEKNKALEAKQRGTKDARDKFELITADSDQTLDDGTQAHKGDLVRIDKDSGKSSRAGGVRGTKLGTNAPKEEGMSPKDAESARKDSDAEYDKSQGAVGKALGPQKTDPTTGKKVPMSPTEVEIEKKKFFKEHNPKAYKVLYGNDPDLSAPPPSATAASSKSAVPSWVKSKQ